MGYRPHSSWMAFTTTILNSSPISPMKVMISFISRSMLLSPPVFSSVVIASVATVRLLSLISISSSLLHLATTSGCLSASCSVLHEARGTVRQCNKGKEGRCNSHSMLENWRRGERGRTLLSVRAATNRCVGLPEVMKMCSVVMAGARSPGAPDGQLQMARAAS